MKKLADYEGNEAIELWADLIEPISRIISDDNIAGIYRSTKSIPAVAKEVLKTHANEATEILLRVDPTPVNGLNVITRTVDIILEVIKSEDLKGFFDFAEQGQTGNVSSGSPTGNTEDEVA